MWSLSGAGCWDPAGGNATSSGALPAPSCLKRVVRVHVAHHQINILVPGSLVMGKLAHPGQFLSRLKNGFVYVGFPRSALKPVNLIFFELYW